MMVPDVGERIFHIVPPRECPALNGVMVIPWHFPKSDKVSPSLAPPQCRAHLEGGLAVNNEAC